MELERNEDHDTSERTKAERSGSGTEQAVFTPPFASEGLEQVRDSHC
ncbi:MULTISPECIES: hypothetical protein [Bradyrhizobium]|nr:MULTISPECIES: hypothetical protein [Bradyrhizobium]